MKNLILLSLVVLVCFGCKEELSGELLLQKSMAYHDPDNNWEKMKCNLEITAEYPNGSERYSSVKINLPASEFSLKQSRGDHEWEYKMVGDNCEISFDGSTEIDETIKEEYRLSCERAATMRDYYTYLYGLPMKLMDEGTIIDPNVETKEFMGKEYLTLKVTYDPNVGADTWYFYFDPETYAMEVYQFYHDESKNDGEYILLSDEIVIGKMRIPKKRAWYMNNDDKYLATDNLTSIN